ncbi:hypothetical protein AB0H76_18700 [Nocardia sp. NPDC050712]|uniref:hypothetical protein n=1 Tax=Nocardia sp. NPDC050712 TaxID=3155518 RepID=UPI0033EF0836
MVSLILLLLAAFQLACVARLGRRPPWLLCVVGLGLAYDSAVVGLGAWLGTGDVLHALSIGRYVGHVLVTPLLVVWVADRVFARRGIGPWLVAAGLVAWGAVTELIGLHLVPKSFADTLRYVPDHPGGPPIPALIVSVVLLVAGIALWRKQGWPWLALAGIVLIVASGAAVALPPLGNAGEAVLLAALVAAERRLSRPGDGRSR